MKSFLCFSNKSGVGSTSLTYHVAHTLSRMGKRTLLVDCDPQCDASTLFLTEDEIAEVWSGAPASHVFGCIDPVRRGEGDVLEPKLREVADDLWLLPGHLSLSRFEQTLADAWPKKDNSDDERARDVTTALDTLSNKAADCVRADYVLIDAGPALGALTRGALLACDAVVVTLELGLFSGHGLADVGPALREWRQDWARTRRHFAADHRPKPRPPHEFRALGYVVQQRQVRIDRPMSAQTDWTERIPAGFRQHVLGVDNPRQDLRVERDEFRLGTIGHSGSLAVLALEARKPMFDLKHADGIGGGMIQAVYRSRQTFEALANVLVERLEAEVHEVQA